MKCNVDDDFGLDFRTSWVTEKQSRRSYEYWSVEEPW